MSPEHTSQHQDRTDPAPAEHPVNPATTRREVG
jgi:hypothetical protein